MKLPNRKERSVTVSEVPVYTNPLTNQSLVDDVLWGRLVARVVQDREFQVLFEHEPASVQLEIAESIIDQAIGFLQIAANGGDGPYSPSERVDIGWHTFLMYTREYADFCQRIAGHMIHHVPSDVPGVDYGTGGIVRTVAAMQVRGMYVDMSLWQEAAGCSDCAGGGGECSAP